MIADCGQHQDGDSWGTAPSDGSGDTHPEFPEDSDVDFKDVSSSFDLQAAIASGRVGLETLGLRSRDEMDMSVRSET